MIISRRPNKRASTEKAPGPRNVRAEARRRLHTAAGFISFRMVRKERVPDAKMKKAASQVRTLASGVANPTRRSAPQPAPTKPPSIAQMVGFSLPAK